MLPNFSMKMHHVVLLCLLSALLDGNFGFVSGKQLVHTEGGNITVECRFFFSGRRKLLCKETCTVEKVLVETEGGAAQRGRYSIRYKEGTFPVSSTVLRVGIAQLTPSDSGRYRCVLERTFLPDSHQEIEIRVTEAPKTSPERLIQPELCPTEEAGAEGYVLSLSACIAALAAAAVLLLYRWKLRRSSDGLTTRGQSRCGNNQRSSRNARFPACQKSAPDCRCQDLTSSHDPIYNNL